MKSIKKVITAATLMMVLMVGTSFGGIILADAQQPQSCTAQNNTAKLSGVILSDVTGIILAQLTGIILADVKDTTTVNCGLILAQ
jgi:hypothetical protein